VGGAGGPRPCHKLGSSIRNGKRGPGLQRYASRDHGFSDLIIKIWWEDDDRHVRSAADMAELPFGISVEIEAEVELNI
jgi:hypothetical protein